MSTQPPKVILRIGSHAEKEYFEKLAPALDGMMFGGNLLEITPAATSSLLHALKTKRAGKPVPYYLDPITYCFGPYVSDKGIVIDDLSSLKSEQFVTRGIPKKHTVVKSSYCALAKALGPVFANAVNDGLTCQAIDVQFLSDAELDAMCEGVADYQWNRVSEILAQESALKNIAAETRPAAIFAPYFFISSRWLDSGIESAGDLAKRTVSYESRAPVHAVICGCMELLTDESVAKIVSAMADSGVAGIWLWIDGFDEFTATETQLSNLRRLVGLLSQFSEVFNLHGGYFSLLLAHDGMAGISHGVGYGERKKVQQVIGGAAPLVRYYLPAIHMRVGVPDLERALRSDLRVTTSEGFLTLVCRCQICRGVMSKSFDNIAAFSDQRPSGGNSLRTTQTPASAKMCRYHFLLNRLSEPKLVAELEADLRGDHVLESSAVWETPFAKELNIRNGDGGYPHRWAGALRNEVF